MQLYRICHNLTGKLLGKPGTLVERMTPGKGIGKGDIYKVKRPVDKNYLELEGRDFKSYHASFFRKAIEI